MNPNLTAYKLLRVYRKVPPLRLINLILCNKCMGSKWLMANAESLYRMGLNMPGKGITNGIIGRVISGGYGGGGNVNELGETVNQLHYQRIPSIIHYCAKGSAKAKVRQQIMDNNAKGYRQSASTASLIHSQLINVKITGLINSQLLRKYNTSVLLRDKLWQKSSENGSLNASKLFQNLQKMYLGLTDQHFSEYLNIIHNYTGQSTEFTVDEVEFKTNHHPYYFFNQHKNDTLVSKILLPLDEEEQQYMNSFKSRWQSILDQEYESDNGLKVICQAQQSYIQSGIDNICQQTTLKYNKQRLYFVHTLQNYLCKAKNILNLQIQLAKRNNLFFGVAFVNGGYKLEQMRRCQHEKSPSPLINNYQQLSRNRSSNYELVLNSGLTGQLFFMELDQKVIKNLISTNEQIKSQMKVNFMFFNSIGDHLNFRLNQQRQTAFKTILWGQPQNMIQHMIGRSEQISQINSQFPIKTQQTLLCHQLFSRLFGL